MKTHDELDSARGVASQEAERAPEEAGEGGARFTDDADAAPISDDADADAAPISDDADAAPISDDERAQASALAGVLDALERGRGGRDDLPDLEASDPLFELIDMTHLMRQAGGAGELSAARAAAVWDTLDQAHARAARAASQGAARSGGARWLRWLLLGVPVVAGVLLLIYVPIALFLPGAGERSSAPPRPAPQAVAALDAQRPAVAQELMRGQDPRGDTRLRPHRRARFDAWRVDATWSQRHGARSVR